MEFFLMGPTGQGQGNVGLFDFLMPFIMVFFIMWFLVIRPQKRQERERQEMLKNLKKGDLVVTSGGMVGKVMEFKDDRVKLKVDESNNTKVLFLRSAIINVINKETNKS